MPGMAASSTNSSKIDWVNHLLSRLEASKLKSPTTITTPCWSYFNQPKWVCTKMFTMSAFGVCFGICKQWRLRFRILSAHHKQPIFFSLKKKKKKNAGFSGPLQSGTIIFRQSLSLQVKSRKWLAPRSANRPSSSAKATPAPYTVWQWNHLIAVHSKGRGAERETRKE